MAAIPPVCDFGWPAPDFRLPATDGKTYSLKDVAGPKGVVVAFICNHCPYVLAVINRIVRDARDLAPLGIGFAAICANDASTHPADSFENMAAMADARDFPFPYLHDESQAVARAYDAACTPDFFGFDAELKLQYRGRLDASRGQTDPSDLRRDLFEAMRQVAEEPLPVLAAIVQFNADENVCIAVVGVAVVKFGYGAVTDNVAKLAQAARTFWNGHCQQGFALFSDFGPFGNMAQPIEIDVRTSINRNQRLIATTLPADIGFESGNSQCAGRLRYREHCRPRRRARQRRARRSGLRILHPAPVGRARADL